MDLNDVDAYGTLTKQQWIQLREGKGAAVLPRQAALEPAAPARSCPVCDVPLPRSASERRVFCSAKCRARAARRRYVQAGADGDGAVVHAPAEPLVGATATPRLVPLTSSAAGTLDVDELSALINALVTTLRASEIEIVYGSVRFFLRPGSTVPEQAARAAQK